LEGDYKAYLRHILDSINLIEKYTQNMSFEEFKNDRKTVDAELNYLKCNQKGPC